MLSGAGYLAHVLPIHACLPVKIDDKKELAEAAGTIWDELGACIGQLRIRQKKAATDAASCATWRAS
jgi:hypothetical protein